MKVAYVDSSALVAKVFGEREAKATIRQLDRCDEVFSSCLLEAELKASMAREQASLEVEMLRWISWVLPDRPLTPEIDRVLATGYLRGADLWHIACALYLADDPNSITFVTLDKQQKAVARKLGFRVSAQ